MKKFMGMLLISSAIYSMNINFDIYGGIQSGNWRIRDTSIDGNLKGVAGSVKLELSSEVAPHMNILFGTGYETGFNVEDGSYDLLPAYIGGRFEFDSLKDEKKWNPYIVGRIGFPTLANEKDTELEKGKYNGWAQISFGAKYKGKFFIEAGYKQHVMNYIPLQKDYDARFFAIDAGYRIK